MPAALLAGLLCLSLAGCGGDDGSSASDDTDMPVAFAIIGQPDFTGYQANRGAPTSALGLAQPQGGAATNGEKLYVADYGNNRILGWNAIPDSVDAAPDFVLGQNAFTANLPGTSTTSLALPASVTIAGDRLIVCDSGNNRVLIWNTLPAANVAADVVIGQPDFVSNEPATTASGLSYPVDATIAGNRLFVADQGNHRVLVWNGVPSTPATPASIVLGQPDFVTAEAGDEEEGLENPSAIWSDGFRLLVSDSGNHRVMFWSQIPRVSYAPASFVLGQADFARSASGASSQQMFTPYGLTSDGTRIYVADSNNNRVLKFDSFPIASGQSATDVFGQDTFSRRTANDDDQDGTSDDNPSARTLSAPTGVFLFSGVLYITDRNNHRLLMFPD
jgi:sugar lactone lactonase YvrE